MIDLPTLIRNILIFFIVTPSILYITNYLLFRQRQIMNRSLTKHVEGEHGEKNEDQEECNELNVNFLREYYLKTKQTTSFSIFNRNKHFTGLVTLILFYLSLIIGIAIFKNKEPITLVPDIKSGTFGLRAWRCKVKVRNIRVTYDSCNIWREIPSSIIYNRNNWKFPVWYKWKKGKRSPYDYYAQFDPDTKEFTLRNCAAFFYPPSSVFNKVFGNIRVSGSVSFIDQDKDTTFPGFQFILHVDTNLVYTETEGKTFSDLCLQYNLNISGYAHPWVPALDWEPASLYRSPIKILLSYGGINGKLAISTNEKSQWYDLTAIWFDEQILYLSHNFGSGKLFETKVERTNIFQDTVD